MVIVPRKEQIKRNRMKLERRVSKKSQRAKKVRVGGEKKAIYRQEQEPKAEPAPVLTKTRAGGLKNQEVDKGKVPPRSFRTKSNQERKRKIGRRAAGGRGVPQGFQQKIADQW